MEGFLLMTHPWSSYLCRCRCTVEQCSTIPESAEASWRPLHSNRGFLLSLQAIFWAVLSESFLGLPNLNSTSAVPVNCYLKILCYLLIAFSSLVGINHFNFQRATQLLSPFNFTPIWKPVHLPISKFWTGAPKLFMPLYHSNNLHMSLGLILSPIFYSVVYVLLGAYLLSYMHQLILKLISLLILKLISLPSVLILFNNFNYVFVCS